MADFIVVAILVVILGAAVRYIYKAKKSGAKCIGCSMSDCCSAKNCGCCCDGEKNKDTSSCCGADTAE